MAVVEWLLFDDLMALPLSFVVVGLALTGAGVMAGTSYTPRLLWGPAGGALGLACAAGISLLVALAAEAWADAALFSAISYAQGGGAHSWVTAEAGCPSQGMMAVGDYTIEEKEVFFGTWEYTVLLPAGERWQLSLRRHGFAWHCTVALRVLPPAS